jgi:hypothetical protein
MLFAPIIRNTTAVYSHRFLSVEKFSTDKNLWLYTAAVLLMMDANSIRNMESLKFIKKEINHIVHPVGIE